VSERKQAIVACIQAAREELIELARGLDARSLARPTCNEGWCVKDLIAHLGGADIEFKLLADQVSRGEPAFPPGFDGQEFNRRQVESHRESSLQELLAEMAAARVSMLDFLESLPEDRLDQVGLLVPGQQVSPENVLRHAAEHDRMHAEEIRQAILG